MKRPWDVHWIVGGLQSDRHFSCLHFIAADFHCICIGFNSICIFGGLLSDPHAIFVIVSFDFVGISMHSRWVFIGCDFHGVAVGISSLSCGICNEREIQHRTKVEGIPDENIKSAEALGL